MADRLDGMRIAVLVANGFEQVELAEPMDALREAGGRPEIVSPEEGSVWGWEFTDWGEEFDVDTPLDEAEPDSYDALLLPGGVMNPDHLRGNPDAVRFVRSFFQAEKPVASICHGPWTLIDAEVVKGRRLTSYHTIRKDLENAGARWTDEEVVVDGNLVTSRNPDDLPAFNRRMVERFADARTRVGAGTGGGSSRRS